LVEWNVRRLAAAEDPIKVGIGVHAGEAFIGAVGDDTRLEFAVLGETVNVANRLEQATKIHLGRRSLRRRGKIWRSGAMSPSPICAGGPSLSI
jgi:class 3 adenylate cyclase